MSYEVALFGNELGLSVFDGKRNIVMLNEGTVEENLKKEVYESLGSRKVRGYNIKDYIKAGIGCSDYFDVMLAWYVLGTESSQDLETVIFAELGENLKKFENQFRKRSWKT